MVRMTMSGVCVRARKLIVVIIMMLVMHVHIANADDGCTLAYDYNNGFKNGICCENGGYGPRCAYCSGQCQPYEIDVNDEATTIYDVRGNSCSMDHNTCSGGIKDCTDILEKKTSIVKQEFQAIGKAKSEDVGWTLAFTRKDDSTESACPVWGCWLSNDQDQNNSQAVQVNWGLQMSGYQNIYHNDNPNLQTVQTNQEREVYMNCRTYGNDNVTSQPYVTSNKFTIELKDSCDSADNFKTKDIRWVLEKTESINSEKSYFAYDYISRPKDACKYYECSWISFENGQCGSSKFNYESTTNKVGGYTAKFETTFKTSQEVYAQQACLKCKVGSSQNIAYEINHGPYDFFVHDCSPQIDRNEVVGDQILNLAYINDEINEVTLFDNYETFFKLSDSASDIQKQYCLPEKVNLYFQYRGRYYDWIDGQKDNQTWITFNQSNTQGKMTVKIDRLNYVILYIKFDIPILEFQTDSFKVQVACGENSTTIELPAGYNTYQTCDLDFEYNTLPSFEVPQFVSTQSLCQINSDSYFIQKSQNDISRYRELEVIEKQNSMGQKRSFIQVLESQQYTEKIYTFTLSVKADGEKQYLVDLQFEVSYNCQYDQLILIDQNRTETINITGYTGEYTTTSINLKKYFTNNASDFCQIQGYGISSIQNYTDYRTLNVQNYEKQLMVDYKSGMFQILNQYSEFKQLRLFIQANNSISWAKGSKAFLDLNVIKRPPPPCFVTSLFVKEISQLNVNVRRIPNLKTYEYNYYTNSSQAFTLQIIPDIGQVSDCNQQLSITSFDVIYSTNELIPSNAKQYPETIEYDGFQNVFGIQLSKNITEANLWAGSYKIQIHCHLQSDPEIWLNVFEFEVHILSSQLIKEDQETQQNAQRQQNIAEKFAQLLTNKQDDKTISQGKQKSQEDDESQAKQVKIWIKEMSRNGEIFIEFNQDLRVPVINLEQNVNGIGEESNQKNSLKKNNDLKNQTRLLVQDDLKDNQKGVQNRLLSNTMIVLDIKDVFDFTVGPIKKQGEDKIILFDPQLVSWTEKFIKIQMNFESPLNLSRTSSGEPQDFLRVKVKNTKYFVSLDSNEELKQDNVANGVSYMIAIPKQLPKDVLEKEIQESANKQENALQIIIILAALFTKSQSQKLINLIMAIQIVSYMPLFKVDFPSELEIYIQALRKIAEFEILPTQEIQDYLRNLQIYNTQNPNSTLDAQASQQQYASIGIKSFDPFENSTGFLLILVFFLILIAFLSFFALIKKLRERIVNQLRSLKQHLIWNGIIATFLLTLLKNWVTFNLVMKDLFISEDQKINVSQVFTIIIVGIPLILFPFWSFKLLYNNKDFLQIDDFQKKYVSLYEDLKQNFKVYSPAKILIFPSVFAMRRAGYVIFGMINFPIVLVNLVLLIYLSIFYFSWLEHTRPFWSRRLHYVERFNELMLLILCYHMLCFTDLTFIESQISSIQASFLTLIASLILVNLFIIFYDSFNYQKCMSKFENIMIQYRLKKMNYGRTRSRNGQQQIHLKGKLNLFMELVGIAKTQQQNVNVGSDRFNHHAIHDLNELSYYEKYGFDEQVERKRYRLNKQKIHRLDENVERQRYNQSKSPERTLTQNKQSQMQNANQEKRKTKSSQINNMYKKFKSYQQKKKNKKKKNIDVEEKNQNVANQCDIQQNVTIRENQTKNANDVSKVQGSSQNVFRKFQNNWNNKNQQRQQDSSARDYNQAKLTERSNRLSIIIEQDETISKFDGVSEKEFK